MAKKSKIPWVCKDCNSAFETKHKLYEHRHSVHHIQSRNTSKICPRCNNHYDGQRREHNKICPAIRHDHTHSEEIKQQLSIARKEWLKNNPDKHPWKKKEKFKSVPCEHLKEILRTEFSFTEEYTDNCWKHNYSIDIAFLDKKLAIEVNGQQHYNNDGTLVKYYQNRHDYLESLGWIILEIHYANCFKKNEIEKIKTAIRNCKQIPQTEYLTLFHNKRKTKQEREKERQVKLLKKQEMWNRRKEMILNSGVDLTKFGWVGKVMKKTGMTLRELEGTIKHFSNEFSGKYFRRNRVYI